jgi:hypothetical protein
MVNDLRLLLGLVALLLLGLLNGSHRHLARKRCWALTSINAGYIG